MLDKTNNATEASIGLNYHVGDIRRFNLQKMFCHSNLTVFYSPEFIISGYGLILQYGCFIHFL